MKPQRWRARGSLARGARFVAAAVQLLALGERASGGYILDVFHDSGSSLEVAPGAAFTLDVVLSSDAADTHNSALFRVISSGPGLWYESYHWTSPYLDPPELWDDSTPALGELPRLLDASAYVSLDPNIPADRIDFELSNVVPFDSDPFGSGLLVSLMLRVDSAVMPGSVISLGVEPDTIANGFSPVPVIAGPVFELFIVPEPAGGLLIAALAVLMPRRWR